MRNNLADRFPIKEATHTGQALQRLLPVKQKQKEEAFTKNLIALTQMTTPESYQEAFDSWEQATEQYIKAQAITSGPLAIGLGNESPYEVGLILHHTYGIPYLPGSALKGIARRAAQANDISKKAQQILFGTHLDNFKEDDSLKAEAGYITFFDGWMDYTVKNPLQLDVITVHHPQYYQKGDVFPTDFDDPNPVQFISVRPEITFHLRVGGEEKWAQLAMQLLDWGLTHLGLGGKTNAGYGSFKIERKKSEAELQEEERRKVEEEEKHKQEEQAKLLEGTAKTLEMRIDGLNLGRPNDRMNLLAEIKKLPLTLRKSLAERLLARVKNDTRTKKDKKLIKQIESLAEGKL